MFRVSTKEATIVSTISLSMLVTAMGCGGAPVPPKPLAHDTTKPEAAHHQAAPPSFCSRTDDSQPKGSDLIARVAVRGLSRIPADDICKQLGTKAGAALDNETVQRDAENIWKMGTVSDVQVESQVAASGRSVTFLVEERPLVHHWTFDGIRGGNQAELIDIIGHDGDVFDPATLRDHVAQVRDEYLNNGYRRSKVDFKVDPLPKNQVDVAITVDEGPRALVDSIIFHGISKLRDTEVSELIDTGKGAYNAVGKPYRPDAMERDRLVIMSYYMDRGMVNVNIPEETLAFSADGTATTITLEISEGMVFKIGKISCAGFSNAKKDCLDLVTVKKGEVFNRSQLSASLDRIRQGQAATNPNVNIEPQVDVDPKKQTIDLKITMTK